jgi:predicted ATPase
MGWQYPRYLQSLELMTDRVLHRDVHPFSVPSLSNLKLSFRSHVTILVGENGSGKSTLIEAIAALCRLPISGGGKADYGSTHGPKQTSAFADALRPNFRERPRDAYFFRGEYSAHFASLLDQRNADPDFRETGDPYALYGGKSLHVRSHGEGFLTLMNERIGNRGLFLLDEPESALSPQRQLALLALLADRIRSEETQFIIATHSPILMTLPDAQILLLEGDTIKQVAFEDTDHYRITKAVLNSPASFWKHLSPPRE